ncbi:MAG TPA: phospholipase D-like domain-containing protein [Burkholderiales bacterium]|nr:phospholipase D-like domain-containing protein [Burkholderiales bacterium]
MPFSRKTRIVAATFVATTLAVLLVANLALGDKRIDEHVRTLYSVEEPQFRRVMEVMLGPGMLPGNRVQPLLNGDEIFPAMLDAIRGARRTITLETYVYYSGRIGAEFSRALAERARDGVAVHVIFDAVGSGRIDERYVQEMAAAGVQVARYNPVRWYTLARMNNRTHRKLLVVDGAVGFTGGAGIADEWTGNAQDPKHWRDTHFRIQGPVVAQLQAAFMENWIEITGEVLHGAEYFPPLAPAGGETAQFFVSSPGGGGESMQLMYLLSIAAAAKRLAISASYFVPDEVELHALADAARRGVRVQIIVPGPHNDAEIVRRASRAGWGELLRAGVEIYEYQPTMYHCKVMIVDGLWVSVGSTNFDQRSFSVNDEANLNVLDTAFAREQERIFAADLERSRRVTLEQWQSRPWTEKLWEHSMGLLGSQL